NPRPSCAICNGRRSSWPPAGYTSAGRRTARRVSTRCRATRYAGCDACSANRGCPRTPLWDGPMTPKAFHALFGRIGARAKMPFPIHPHMLRHGPAAPTTAWHGVVLLQRLYLFDVTVVQQSAATSSLDGTCSTQNGLVSAQPVL